MSQRTLRSALESDRVALGSRSLTLSPEVIEIYGDIGLDFAWMDFEHMGESPFDSRVLERLTRAAELSGIDILARPPSADPHLIRKMVDTNVRSLLVPRVETAAEVERAIGAARFRYDGRPGERGAGSGRANEWGARGGEEYVQSEDSEVTVGCMIENETAVDNLTSILSVPELGFAYIGLADLSISLGHPYETDHPDVVEMTEHVRETCREHDVPVGRNAKSADRIEQAIEAGYRVLRIGDEAGAIRDVLGRRLDRVR
jgi:2-dehydro-3-deoxyglucarate aldolase